MAKRAVREANKDVARVWQQRSTRAAILEAARRLATREDAAQLTLARVADEANFSPNTVYAYFVNKTELMLAIVADDLAALAREMRDVFPANEDVGTVEDSQPETPEAEQSGEGKNSTLAAEDKAEIADTHDTAESSLLSDAASNVLPGEEERAADPVDEIVTDGSDQTVLQEAPQAASELADIVAADTVVEPTTETERLEPEIVDDPTTVPVVDESTQQHHAPDAEPEAAASFASDPDANVETTVTPEFVQPEPDPFGKLTFAAVTGQSTQQYQAPEAEPEVPFTSAAEHGADEETTPEATELAGDAYQPESQSSGVTPEGQASQHDTDRNAETDGVLARLQESIARLEARPVDAWLERRLRELERMIASLEERQGHSERSSGAASGVVEETVRDIQARLEAVEKNRQLDFESNAKSLNERVDASDKRLRDMLGELRSLAMMSSSRLDVLESDAGKRASLETFHAAPASENSTVAENVPQDAPVEKPDSSVDNAEAPPAELSYLSQARRSAMAAAAQAVAQPDDSNTLFASTMSSIKTASSGSRYLVAGGIALLVVLLGAGLALKRQAADSDEAAQPPVQVATAAHDAHGKLVSGRTMAPQIRLASLADRGNVDAELLLGLEYLDGTGAMKNESEAAQWISRSAARGDAVAQFWLGTLYADGKGVKSDPALAMHWYEEAAMQGNRKAMHQLAVSYAEGWGATRNYAEAARWFSRAASLGYVDSAFNLGVLYERGLGMPQSLLDAYKWYSIAAAMGDKGSPPRLAVLKTQMKADDIAGATQAANSFTPDTIDQAANIAPQIAQLPKG